MSVLDKELETYKKLLPTFIKDQGKFVVIHEEKLIGIYESYEDALKIAYKECGLKPFLVKRISYEESVSYFTRDFSHSCLA